MSELSAQFGVNLDKEENCDRFKQGFADGFWDEVQRSGKAMLPDKGNRTP